MLNITKAILKDIYQQRPKDARKYDYGLVLVIGGNDFYTGSPALAGMAAFRAGVDMVRIVAPKRAADIIASFSPNLASYPLDGERLGKEDVDTLILMTKSAQESARHKAAVVIGGGLGRSPETQEAIVEYLSQVSVKTVIDADAIYAIAEHPEVIKNKNFLITPHIVEFNALTGRDITTASDRQKQEEVLKEAERLNTTILLKGKVDILVSNGKKLALNKRGSPYLTVGGTGDTLAGIAGALLARGEDCFRAGCAAALLNSLAGEKAARRFKDSLLATDLIEEIPNALTKIK